MSYPTSPSLPTEAPILADHLALDLLNTEAGAGAERTDYWNSADDVLQWLHRCGVDAGRAADASLLSEARQLRALARAMIERRQRGDQGEPREIERLNHHLAALPSVPLLEWMEAPPHLVRRLPAPSPARALGVLAEAVATLLAEGDFMLVRQCEHPDCVLWFYDRTRSHRRRWCSMALCGNRHKAAEFRKRSRTEPA